MPDDRDGYEHGYVPLGKIVAALAALSTLVLGFLGKLIVDGLQDNSEHIERLQIRLERHDEQLEDIEDHVDNLEDLHPRSHTAPED